MVSLPGISFISHRSNVVLFLQRLLVPYQIAKNVRVSRLPINRRQRSHLVEFNLQKKEEETQKMLEVRKMLKPHSSLPSLNTDKLTVACRVTLNFGCSDHIALKLLLSNNRYFWWLRVFQQFTSSWTVRNLSGSMKRALELLSFSLRFDAFMSWKVCSAANMDPNWNNDNINCWRSFSVLLQRFYLDSIFHIVLFLFSFHSFDYDFD